jgi:hypothetical protein
LRDSEFFAQRKMHSLKEKYSIDIKAITIDEILFIYFLYYVMSFLINTVQYIYVCVCVSTTVRSFSGYKVLVVVMRNINVFYYERKLVKQKEEIWNCFQNWFYLLATPSSPVSPNCLLSFHQVLFLV